MTTRKFVQLFIYLLAGSSFLWSLGNSSVGDPVSGQVVGSPNPRSNSRNAKSFSPMKLFLMQSYYDRYTSLHDSDFENFMSHEVTSDLCEALPENHSSILRLPVLKRDLVGEGSHRRISTLIKLETQQLNSLSKLLSYPCKLIMIERLPSGVFADPFELQHLAQRGVFDDIAVFGDTNLELPSFLSNRSAVEIHLDIDPNTLLQPADIRIELPLHARYQPLNESGYSIVEFGAPDTILRCSTKEKVENSSCLFKLKNDDSNLYDAGLVWRIPSGKKVKTIKVSNVSLGASEQDLKEFFSFSGDIEYVEMQRSDPQGAETAVLLSGATIVDLSVNITLDSDYQLPPAALASSVTEGKTPSGADSALRKAEDVVTGMLAKGFILGKDAVNKAKGFDEKHQLTSTASAKVTSFDQKLGLSEKLTAGASFVSGRVKEVDQKFQVSEKTKSAFAAAEQKVSTAGSAIMKNRDILTGTSWVTGAFSKVAKAAEDVGQKTKEKVENAEVEQNRKVEDQYAQVLSESPKAAATSELHSSKPAPAQGLIL